MHKPTKSEQLEAERQSLAAEVKTMAPDGINKMLLRIALASLEAQIAILHPIERNTRI